MTAAKWQMPARLKEAGLSEDQCRIAYGYWMNRVKFARQQRNAIVGMLLILLNWLMTRAFIDEDLAAGSQFTSFAEVVISWMVPLALVLSVIVLVVMEAAIYVINKKIADPVLGMTPKAIAHVRRMGNSAALHTMLFRKLP